MDAVTLAMAKKYADGQRIAYEEVKSVVIGKGFGEAKVPFDSPIGLNVAEFVPNRLMLTTPVRKPDISKVDEAANNICDGDMLFVGYHTFNRLLDTPALFVACPTLGGYDFQQGWAFVYAFDTTSDTMGMGLTITNGWYAINSNTFEIIPIDLATHPVSVNPDIIGGGVQPGCEEYMADLFPLTEHYEYTVTQDNIIDWQNGDYYVTAANMGRGEMNDFFMWIAPMFLWCSDSTVDVNQSTKGIFTISWAEVHKIDPKFLPGVCLPLVELTTELNADSKLLTSAESEKLNEAAANGTPCVISFNVAGTEANVAIAFLSVSAEGGMSFVVSLGNAIINVYKGMDTEEQWIMTYVST